MPWHGADSYHFECDPSARSSTTVAHKQKPGLPIRKIGRPYRAVAKCKRHTSIEHFALCEVAFASQPID